MGINKPMKMSVQDSVILEGGHVKADNQEEDNVWSNFNLRLRSDMKRMIDYLRKDRPGMSRSAWITETIMAELKRHNYD